MKSHSVDMLNGPLLPRIFVFSVPVIAAGVLQLLFNAADVVVVGRWAGSQALAAVGSNSALTMLFINLFNGISVGVNVVAARYLGARDEKQMDGTVHTAISLALISGLLTTLIGGLGARQFLVWMGSPDDVLPLAAVYLRIYFLGMPGLMVYNFGSALLRAAGDTRRPLVYLAAAGILNVALNLVLVIGFHLSVVGVGVATAISQYLSAGLILRCLCRETGPLKLDLHRLRIEKNHFSVIMRIGLPAGVQGVVFSLSNVVIQSSVNSFGSVVMAGNAAGMSIEGFVYVSMNAVYQACLTFTSQNLGAGNCRRCDRVLVSCLGLVTAIGFVLGNGAVLFGKPLLSLYSSDPAVLQAGTVRLFYISGIYWLCGIMDVLVGAIRGLGHGVAPAVVSMFGVCGIRLLWVATVFRVWHTQASLYISYPVSWGVVAVVHFICWLVIRKKVYAELAKTVS